MISEKPSLYSQLKAFPQQYLLRKKLKDTYKNDTANMNSNIFLPEGSCVFQDQQIEGKKGIGFFGGSSAMFPNMWNRKTMSVFTFETGNRKKVELLLIKKTSA